MTSSNSIILSSIGKTVRKRLAILTVTAIASGALLAADASASLSVPQFCTGSVDPNKVKSMGRPAESREGKRRQGGLLLVVSKNRVTPGSNVYARLVNNGTQLVGYGREFRIERYTATKGWFLDPNSPKGPWTRELRRLSGESAGLCYRFEVPSDQSPGRYRFSTKIHFELGTSRRAERRTAEFAVR
jgi:hypothetical protein